MIVQFKTMLVRSLLTLALATAASPLVAAPLVYFGGPDASKADLTNSNAARDAFLGTLDSYGLENLSGVTAAPSLTFNFTGTSITGTTSTFTSPNSGLNTFNLYAVTGDKFVYDDGAKNDSITFSEPITAFGTYFTQAGDGAANTLTIRLENTVAGTSVDVEQNLGGDWGPFNVTFLGITDVAPFNRVTFIESLDSDGILWDDLYAGHLVPEPSTWALLAMGLTAGLFARPRRKSRRVE